MGSLAWHGIKVIRRGNAARMVVSTPVLVQVVAVLACLAAALGMSFLQSEGDLRNLAPSWVLWTVVVAILALVLYRYLFHRLFITIKGQTLIAERKPLPFPRPFRVQLADLKSIDTDVKVTEHRDKYGQEHETFRFTVQLSLISDWRPRRLYRTRSESAAVTFRQNLLMMVENARAMNAKPHR